MLLPPRVFAPLLMQLCCMKTNSRLFNSQNIFIIRAYISWGVIQDLLTCDSPTRLKRMLLLDVSKNGASEVRLNKLLKKLAVNSDIMAAMHNPRNFNRWTLKPARRSIMVPSLMYLTAQQITIMSTFVLANAQICDILMCSQWEQYWHFSKSITSSWRQTFILHSTTWSVRPPYVVKTISGR